MDGNYIQKTNAFYWNTKGNEYINAIVLPLYGAFISDEKYHLFGDVSGKKMLEIGCGNGMSLQYQGERGAGELWGMDISESQLEKAQRHLDECGASAKLICSPMEDECGIPQDYFDFVYSIYAIGWTVDLDKTFRRIASYLKKDGVFIFSWSHPIHKCIVAEDGKFKFENCYFDESWKPVPLDDGELKLANRMMSTYVNALAEAGFAIEKMVEESDMDIIKSAGDESNLTKRARIFPVTFVIKARKL